MNMDTYEKALKCLLKNVSEVDKMLIYRIEEVSFPNIRSMQKCVVMQTELCSKYVLVVHCRAFSRERVPAQKSEINPVVSTFKHLGLTLALQSFQQNGKHAKRLV